MLMVKKPHWARKIDPEHDTVEVKNLEDQSVYYAYNKPKGIVTTTPQKGEIDIIHHTHFPHKVFPIGGLRQGFTRTHYPNQRPQDDNPPDR